MLMIGFFSFIGVFQCGIGFTAVSNYSRYNIVNFIYQAFISFNNCKSFRNSPF